MGQEGQGGMRVRRKEAWGYIGWRREDITYGCGPSPHLGQLVQCQHILNAPAVCRSRGVSPGTNAHTAAHCTHRHVLVLAARNNLLPSTMGEHKPHMTSRMHSNSTNKTKRITQMQGILHTTSNSAGDNNQ